MTASSHDLQQTVLALAQGARGACRPLARARAMDRSRAIAAMAQALEDRATEVMAANAEDLDKADQKGLSGAMRDRLHLSPDRFAGLATALRGVADMPDPVGSVSRQWQRPNGLQVEKVRLPLGVILMIYESRPNVTLDAAALCLRSGNAAILRGGGEAEQTNRALMQVVQAGLKGAGLPREAVQMVPTQDRAAVDLLLKLDEWIDLVIPRGGEGLIRRVAENSRIPVVKHYKGICHVFVEASADVEMAQLIVENSKVQRPGVCNALETLLVDEAVAPRLLPPLVQRLHARGVELRGCQRSVEIAPEMAPASDSDWDTEFLDLILAVRIVNGLTEAIEHIDRHGSQHTASIVTANGDLAEQFCRQVDASCVMVNASTRFNDGGELGLGAEMGISTTRVHAYGPMGVESLTAEKFVVRGEGHVRP